MNRMEMSNTILNVSAQAMQSVHKVVNFRSVQFEKLTPDGLHKVSLVVSSTAPAPRPTRKTRRQS